MVTSSKLRQVDFIGFVVVFMINAYFNRHRDLDLLPMANGIVVAIMSLMSALALGKQKTGVQLVLGWLWIGLFSITVLAGVMVADDFQARIYLGFAVTYLCCYVILRHEVPSTT